MKNLQNLGQALSKAEQQIINGGKRSFSEPDCAAISAGCSTCYVGDFDGYVCCMQAQGC